VSARAKSDGLENDQAMRLNNRQVSELRTSVKSLTGEADPLRLPARPPPPPSLATSHRAERQTRYSCRHPSLPGYQSLSGEADAIQLHA
jgi:hypothetical protein